MSALPLHIRWTKHQRTDEVSESRHSPPDNGLQVFARQVQQHISVAELLGYSNQLCRSKIIRKGNLYTKFNILNLKLTTWLGCRKINWPLEIPASPRSSCFRSTSVLGPELPFCIAGWGEEHLSASLGQDRTAQLQKHWLVLSWLTKLWSGTCYMNSAASATIVLSLSDWFMWHWKKKKKSKEK